MLRNVSNTMCIKEEIGMKLKAMIASSVMTLTALGTVTAYAATTNTTGTTSSSTSSTSTSTASTTSGQGHHAKGAGFWGVDIASILGIDKTTLQSDLKAGQSLAQIAQSKGIDESTLISDIESAEKAQLDKAVSAGKLTYAQEQKLLTNAQSRIQQMVEHTGGFAKGSFQGAGSNKGAFAPLSDIASILGVDTSTLQSDLKAGQSLAQIAQSKGIDESTLVSDIESAEKTQLDKAVSAGKLTSSEEQKILSNADTMITKLVERTGAPQQGHAFHHGKRGSASAQSGTSASAGSSSSSGSASTSSSTSTVSTSSAN